MFHVDMTFEDIRIIADMREKVGIYTTILHDNLTGESRSLDLTPKQLGYVFAFNMDNNGEPEGFEKMYQELEPLLVGIPLNLRPIP